MGRTTPVRRAAPPLLILLALGCATSPDPPPANASPPSPSGPGLSLAVTELEETNLGQTRIEGAVETWMRPGLGPVLYASPRGEALDCAPNVTVLFGKEPTSGAVYRVGEDVQIFIEAQCGVAGEVRSWRGVSGSVTVASTGAASDVTLSKVRMQPGGGDNAAFGMFVADGASTP